MVASADAADPRGSAELDDAARLEILKALGDNTRYALYCEIARADAPVATADVADRLGLHVNTVRPHLERMRDVGLLEVHSFATGGVGRPQHRYALAADAPRFGLSEPPAAPVLSRMLLDAAVASGVTSEAAVAAGTRQGRSDAQVHQGESCPEALIAELDRLGFRPQVATADGATVISFGHCPYIELAESQPEVVCGMHRGMVEGFVNHLGGDVASFRALEQSERCQVELRREVVS